MPQVSVVIPAYNSMEYLPATIASVLEQTFTDFELLIINDGSTDDLVAWAAHITDPRVRLISQDNQGVSVARNRGITASQGKYIAFLDADDLWEPTKLEKQVRCFENDPEVGLVDTCIFFADEQGNRGGVGGGLYESGNVWTEILQRNLLWCGSTPLVRRDCFETVGLFDTDLRSAEDWHMWTRIASRFSFAIIKEPLVYYRQHRTNKSGNIDRAFLFSCKTIEKIYELVPPELGYLKKRAYGRLHLHTAWRYLRDEDFINAGYHWRQVFGNWPRLARSRSYIMLSQKILMHRAINAFANLRRLAFKH
jgi:glycosyltransferase involved in cell wall biosynthesis